MLGSIMADREEIERLNKLVMTMKEEKRIDLENMEKLKRSQMRAEEMEEELKRTKEELQRTKEQAGELEGELKRTKVQAELVSLPARLSLNVGKEQIINFIALKDAFSSISPRIDNFDSFYNLAKRALQRSIEYASPKEESESPTEQTSYKKDVQASKLRRKQLEEDLDVSQFEWTDDHLEQYILARTQMSKSTLDTLCDSLITDLLFVRTVICLSIGYGTTWTEASQYQPLCLIFIQHALTSLNDAIPNASHRVGGIVDAINSLTFSCNIKLKMKAGTGAGINPSSLLTAASDLGIFPECCDSRAANDLTMIIELKKPLDSLRYSKSSSASKDQLLFTLESWSASVRNDLEEVAEAKATSDASSAICSSASNMKKGLLTDLFSIHFIFSESSENKQTYYVSQRKHKAKDFIRLLLAAFVAQNDPSLLTRSSDAMIKVLLGKESDEQKCSKDDVLPVGEGNVDGCIDDFDGMALTDVKDAVAEVTDDGDGEECTEVADTESQEETKKAGEGAAGGKWGDDGAGNGGGGTGGGGAGGGRGEEGTGGGASGKSRDGKDAGMPGKGAGGDGKRGSRRTRDGAGGKSNGRCNAGRQTGAGRMKEKSDAPRMLSQDKENKIDLNALIDEELMEYERERELEEVERWRARYWKQVYLDAAALQNNDKMLRERSTNTNNKYDCM